MSHFLVESYLSRNAASGGGAAIVAPSLLQTVYVPEDELCLSLFEAESAEQAERTGRDAGMDVGRVMAVTVTQGALR